MGVGNQLLTMLYYQVFDAANRALTNKDRILAFFLCCKSEWN